MAVLGDPIFGRPVDFIFSSPPVITPPVYATSFSVSAPSTFYAGIAGSITVSPVGGVWNGQTISGLVSGIQGSFGPAVIATGSSPVSISFTPSAAGSGTVNAAVTGMTGSGAQSITVLSQGQPGTAPPKLSDLHWTQPFPTHPNAQDYDTVGYFDPVNGIGPYKIAFTVAAANGNNTSSGYAFRNGGLFVVSVFGGGQGSVAETITATCTDGRGDTVTKSFPISKFSDTTARLTVNGRNPVSNAFADGVYGDRHVRANVAGGTYGSAQYQFIGQDGNPLGPNGFYYIDGGSQLSFQNGHPPAATYPVRVITKDSNGQNQLTLDYNWVITAPAPISYIEFIPKLVSTSMTVGSVVGKCAATSPNNQITWTINDSTSTFAIDASGTVVIRNQPTATGPITFSITATDDNQTFTIATTINVVQGQTLDPSAMSFTLNSSLDNGTNSIGQSVFTSLPTVAGMDGTPQWTLVQENFNYQAMARGTLGYLFSVNPNTGAITVNNLLMAKSHNLVLACTNGIKTCTRVISLPVAWAPVTRTIYAGAGMAAAHGADGFEHLGDALTQVNGGPRATTTQLNIVAHADENYFAEDNGVKTGNDHAGFAVCGPLIITGIAANGRQQPRVGGDTNKWSSTGFNVRYGYGKGFLVCGDGDAIVENLEFSHCFGGDQLHGIEAIRKDGETYGNFTIRNCRISNCDNGIETGFGGSDIICYNNEIVGCGTSHVGSGACHNFYIGQQWSADIHDNYSVMSMTGHDFKSRAMTQKIYNNRFYDLSRGGASNCINLPEGGIAEVYGNKIQKGTMAQNPYAVQFADEAPPTGAPDYKRHHLNFHDNEITVLTLDGGHTTGGFVPGIAVVRHWEKTSYYGEPSTVEVANNRVYMNSAHCSVLSTADENGNTSLGPNARTTETGTTLLTAPVAPDFSRPYLTGTMPRFGWYRTVTQSASNPDYADYDGYQIDPGMDDIFISASAAPGTLISTMAAHAQMDDFYGAPNQPFGSGTAWILSQDDLYYTGTYNPLPWAANGLFTLTAQSDGTAQLKIGAASVAAGTYWIQPKATAPNGTVSKNRFAVRVTA